MLFCGCWNAYLQLLVIIYLRIIISLHLVCLPTLNLKTFKQQLCLAKIGYANALSVESNSCKKAECDNIERLMSSKKSSANLTMVGWNNSRVVNIASSKSSKPKIFVWRLSKILKSIFKNNN